MLEAFTLALAIATILLAGATVWNTFEQRWRDEREATRAALLEQYTNARRWYHARPGIRSALARQLAGEETPTDAVREFITHVDLPSDLTANLVWLLDRVQREDRRFAEEFQKSEPDRGAGDIWDVQLDQIQTIQQLIAAHARSVRHLRSAADSFTEAKWLTPIAGPADWREQSRMQQEAQDGRPPFPSGNVLAVAHPHARDVASYGSEQALQLTRDAPGLGLGELYQAQMSQSQTPSGKSRPWWLRGRRR
jgi:hypothetical protein